MRIRDLRASAAAILLSFFVTACTTPAGVNESDQTRTRAEGAGVGLLAGAAAGAALGSKKGGLIGAGLGALAGLAVGDAVARKKAAYAQRETALRDSADRAELLARQTHEQNESLAASIASLQADIQRLRAQEMSAAAKRDLAQANQIKLAQLLKDVNGNIQRVSMEIVAQQTLLAQEQKLAQQNRDNSLQPAMQRVATDLRDLQSNERRLEEARLQLQLIEQKRAY